MVDGRPRPERPGVPSEQEIVSLLASLRPLPSEQFHARMAAMPWMRPPSVSKPCPTWLARLPRRLRTLTVVAAFLAMVALSALVISPVRTVASEVMGLFTRAHGDHLTIQVPASRPWQLPPRPSTPMTVSEAEGQAGFRAKVPAGRPAGYHFDGAYYLPEMNGVQLAYVYDGSVLMTVTQWPANRDPESRDPALPDVGQSAAVEIVQVGSVMGEYVHGGWAVVENQEVAAVEDGGMLRLQVVWDPDAAMQVLRWQEGYMLFEIAVVGEAPGCEGYLERDEVVMLARSLQ